MGDEDETLPLEATDPDVRELLGMFDVPAFARRGQELEHGLNRLHARCRRERSDLLEMVRLRLKQWSEAVAGTEAESDVFTAPITPLWFLTGAVPSDWGTRLAPPRRRNAIARDLIVSVERFNSRWTRFIHHLNLTPVNTLIDHYNRYYVLEKECVFRSARLAARHFEPRAHVTADTLIAEYPPLPLPQLRV